MAIRVLQSSVIANYDVSASAKFHAGDGLVVSTTDGTVKLPNSAVTYAIWAGFALGDHNTTSNTMIQNDPVGSTVVSADGSTFTSYATGFYTGAKRAIGDWQDETVNVVTNLTDSTPASRRGMGVLRAEGSQFVSDRVTVGSAITYGTPLFCVTSATIDTGGKLTDTASTNGVSVARADSYDSTAALVYATVTVTGVAAV
jgi:hypothetical protein